MENFKNVVTNHKIQIPILQRDYAQGRNDQKSTQIREEFLESIGEVLSDDFDVNELHLDFIYGSFIDDRFIPLDGQQRLTTLFLLHWYFGKKENIDSNYLRNFTYETRASSREFCNKLILAEINFKHSNISDQIKDSNWFLAYWERDPTIQAMLVMIDNIHNDFFDQNYYSNLDRITFNFFKLEDFGLDDDLYIKMNARGKSLTGFEIFKAKFEKFLSGINEESYSYFSQRIDNEWTDYFWKYGVNDKSFLIDKFFINFLKYITEMLHYKCNTSVFPSKLTYPIIYKIYKSSENIKFLFDSLDSLKKISTTLIKIFSKNEYESGKLCLFDSNIDILDKIIVGSFVNIQQRILLFIVINHIIEYESIPNLIDTLRVTRNLTNRIRHLKRGYIYYSGDLMNDQIHDILRLFSNLNNKDIYQEIHENSFDLSNTGITQKSFAQEKIKAKLIITDQVEKNDIFSLEDFVYTRGDIHNFLNINDIKISLIDKTIKGIFSKKDSTIIRTLLTIDDYSINIGWTMLGDKFFFGKNKNWEIILTEANREDFYNTLLKKVIDSNSNINQLILNFLDKYEERDWRYYFVKYPEMTSVINSLSTDNNVYSWHGDFSAEKMGGSNLNAYHLNPYIYTISKKIEKGAQIVQYDSLSYLFHSGLKIYSVDEGWKIYNFEPVENQSKTKKFQIIQNEDSILLIDENDRIETLLDFISCI